ncbi:MAG: AAA family ATPase [Syntrophomonas sp.]
MDPAILTASIEQRKEYFNNYITAHPLLNEATEGLFDALVNAKPKSLILVCGPSKVGLTVLVDKVIKKYYDHPQRKMEDDVIPIISIEADAPDHGDFDWTAFYKQALQELKEPQIECKIDYQSLLLKETRDGILRLQTKKPDLRKELINSLKRWQVRACIIDKAQHLGIITGNRKVNNQLDTIKSLASKSSTVHVLVGTYDVLDLLGKSAELYATSEPISFPCYTLSTNEGKIGFLGALKGLQMHLPIKNQPDLISQWKFFYEQSIGCIGILKDILYRALSYALDHNQSTIEMKVFERYAKPIEHLIRMKEEADLGEKRLQKISSESKRFKQDLGISEKPKSEPKSKNKSVGQRNPSRDPIGCWSQEEGVEAN